MNLPSQRNRRLPTGEPVGPLWRARLLRWFLAGSVLILAGMGGAEARGQSASECKVKSVFLFHFAQFIEWPASSAGTAKQPLVIGVFDDEPMASVLEETVKGETVNQRPLEIKRCSTEADLGACHVVFIGRSRKDQVPSLLRASTKRPVVTVGETDGFAEAGGMLNFYVQDNKVRFEANPEAAERAGLKISSRLLKLARIVRPRATDPGQ